MGTLDKTAFQKVIKAIGYVIESDWAHLSGGPKFVPMWKDAVAKCSNLSAPVSSRSFTGPRRAYSACCFLLHVGALLVIPLV
jgi:hypothetical protein